MPMVKALNATQVQLANGLRVIVLPQAQAPWVSYQLFTDLPINRDGENAGVAKLVQGMLLKGSATRNEAGIQQVLEQTGASLYLNEAGLYGSAPVVHKETLLQLMADLLMRPAFNAKDYEALREQMSATLGAAEATPQGVLDQVTQVLCHGKEHPYGELITASALRKIPLATSRQYHATNFKPELTYLVIMGDITPEVAEADAKKYFEGWKKGLVLAKGFKHPGAPAATKIAFVPQDTASQAHIRISYPLSLKPGADHERNAQIIGYILKQRIRATGLAQELSLSIQGDRYAGIFSLKATVPTAQAAQAIALMQQEMGKLVAEPIDSVSLRQAKNQVGGAWLRSLQQPENLGLLALRAARHRLPTESNTTYLQKIDSLSATDLLRTAQAIIRPAQAYIVVVGSPAIGADALASLGPLHYYDNQGEEQLLLQADTENAVTAASVVSRYLAALAAPEVLDSLKDLSLIYEGEVQGMEFTMTMQRKGSDKLRVAAKVSNLVLNESRFNGVLGVMLAKNGTFVRVDEKALPQLRHQALIFPERYYEALGYELQMGSPELIDGKSYHAIVVTHSDGIRQTDVFDPDTGLKTKVMYTQNTASGLVSVVNEFGDYREVDGLMLPGKIRMAGSLPIPLELSLKEAKRNQGMDDKLFE